jgi:hypothetical protein
MVVSGAKAGREQEMQSDQAYEALEAKFVALSNVRCSHGRQPPRGIKKKEADKSWWQKNP